MKKLLTIAVLAAISRTASMAENHFECQQPINIAGTVFSKTLIPEQPLSFGIRQATDKTTAQNPTIQQSSETHTVKVIVDPDGKGNDLPQGVWIMQDNYISYQSMRKKENVFNVPTGKYIIQAIFTNNDDAGAILFFPDIEVDGPKEIHINAAMADKKVTASFILPSGEEAVLPVAAPNGGATDDPYNVKTITADNPT